MDWCIDGVVSIVVPTYKEQANIKPLVEKLHCSLNRCSYEIIIVDDDSQDGTIDVINSLAMSYPIKAIVRKGKKGLASAVVDGIRQASGYIVVVMDADLQHPPEFVPALLQALQDSDLAIGSRYCKGGSPGEWVFSRKIVSAAANLMALPLMPDVKDRMSGFFAFRRDAINPDLINAIGWKIGLEVMVRGHYQGGITEVPYTFAPRSQGSSKLSKNTIWQYLKQLGQLYSYKFQISSFMIVGLIGYVINMLVYSLLSLNMSTTETTFFGQHFYLVPFVISSLLAITSNYILNKVWTFKGWTEQRLGSLRYLGMALATLVLDMAVLSALVDWFKMPPIPSAALAILMVFIIRFIIARRWVWSKKYS